MWARVVNWELQDRKDQKDRKESVDQQDHRARMECSDLLGLKAPWVRVAKLDHLVDQRGPRGLVDPLEGQGPWGQ